MYKIYSFYDLYPEPEAYLRERAELTLARGLDKADAAARLAEAHGAVLSGQRVDAALLERAPLLRAVANIAVGYDNYDLNAMRARGVVGTITPDVLSDEVADLALALMLSACRRVAELDRGMRAGTWPSGEAASFGMSMTGKTLGIIGMGRIGQRAAHKAHFGFGMDILYHNRTARPEAESAYGAKLVTLNELLSNSDFVLMLAPLTPSTRAMMGREQFAKMKPTAFFINVSRGGCVDEPALIDALRSGVIRGAGLDVFANEPIEKDNPLLFLGNVTLTPHVGSATRATRNAMQMLAARSLLDVLDGRPCATVVPELR